MINLFNSVDHTSEAFSIIKGVDIKDDLHSVYNPANLNHLLGQVAFASDNTINNSKKIDIQKAIL